MNEVLTIKKLRGSILITIKSFVSRLKYLAILFSALILQSCDVDPIKTTTDIVHGGNGYTGPSSDSTSDESSSSS